MLSSLMEQMGCDTDQSHLKHHFKPSVQSNSASLFQRTIRRERERDQLISDEEEEEEMTKEISIRVRN